MEDKFIYVFSIEDRDRMIAANYRLMRSDDFRHMYIFENDYSLKFSDNPSIDVRESVVSDVLIF